MKNILLLVHDDPGQEARLQVALDVTRALDGHLECLDVKNLPLLISDYYADPEAVVMTAERLNEAANREQVEKRLAIEDVPWSMGETYGTFDDALTYASDFADLIVVSSRIDEGPDQHSHLQSLPLKAERPILAVPPACHGLNTSGSVLIAWDGSRACNEAVRAAIPFLQLAKGITLLKVNKQQGAFAMKETATYLSRYGISPELVERNTDGLVADLILDHARYCDAALIVMGAYGPPRLAEMVFGGVTRTMLLKAEIPLLLAH